MKFVISEEQRALAEAIDQVIESLGGTAVARAASEGDAAPARALWEQLAELGLLGLCIDEADGGMGGTPVDLIVAFERLGYHAAPGPYLESAALLPDLVDPALRESLADGSAIATAAIPGFVPYALDAQLCSQQFIVTADSITPAEAGEGQESIDAARTLHELTPAGPAAALDPEAVALAIDRATLGSAAMLLGAGERLLEEAVAYAKLREQFGRVIGEYQGLKHQLANVRVALTFARPLLKGAALDLGTPSGERSMSAAKVAASDAAILAARTALQVHGAIGYTQEHDLSLWLTRVHALASAWGTTRYHRSRIAASILTPAAILSPAS
ncbi:acyl-CoA dehydrogenase family protein [Glutamicibacter protophormiae]|uniref:Alkylation response protein AidB-like acyl-CoA dehydrogenase n=1 Tax=Glutamicibacter protophormiae TaxID=37930 RepID=A0ABS4XPZ9_GLUPR|nr:acyl-CoA dehydrogenase family protein [Glutamicibacter protophormiae]MBP2397798.1 alkylation response protein AidB-like acyl-CoA dehydrogenase [Glutamicibacter protophormiae]GGL86514.1 putative acyl-CoA dehydrogenase FadE [Glutamicibacter protophormiae]